MKYTIQLIQEFTEKRLTDTRDNVRVHDYTLFGPLLRVEYSYDTGIKNPDGSTFSLEENVEVDILDYITFVYNSLLEETNKYKLI